MPDTYKERDRLLKKMGFDSYSEYLASPIWPEIRQKLLTRFPNCHCGQPAQQVHHIRYTEENLKGKSLENMRPICRKCHDKVEFGKKGRKRSLAAAQQKFWRMTHPKPVHVQRPQGPRKKGQKVICDCCGSGFWLKAETDPTCPTCKTGIARPAVAEHDYHQHLR